MSSTSTQLVYTIPQLVEVLQLSRSTIYRLIADGSLEPIEIRGKTRVRVTAVDRFLDAAQRRHRNTTVGLS